MSRRVFDPADDAYRELTTRPLLVIDTETTDVGKDQPHRVVSYAYALIENGELTRKNAYHSLVNPGVPISTRTQEVHGISDADVASKRGFGFHVPRLARMLATPDVVLVAHNVNFDVSVLRAEFDRAGYTLPDIPVIDTMYLPRTLGYQPDTLGTRPALALLASTLGVTNTRPHSADTDTDTTAKVLLRLLREAAATGQLVTIEDLLAAHDRGTTADITGNVHIRGNGSSGPVIPDAHLARHTVPLTSHPTTADIADWLDRASECVALTCPLLASEAEAARPHVNALFKPLHKNLASTTEPGQVATLVGGLMRLMAPGAWPRLEVWWWRNASPVIAAAARCESGKRCPDCRAGCPCPLDVAIEWVGQSVLRDDQGLVTTERIDDRIMKASSGYVGRWKGVDDLTARLTVLCIEEATRAGEHGRAARYQQRAVALGLHERDQRLALRVAQDYAGQQNLVAARDLLTLVSRPGSTSHDQAAVVLALGRIDAHEARDVTPNRRRTPGTTSKARPGIRTRVSPYAGVR